MGISIGSDSPYAAAADLLSKNKKAEGIKETLNNKNATDEELMDACKSFESYMLEQVFKSMESTVPKSEEEENNPYLSQFGDMLYEKVAEDATKNNSFGLAQMLYESMKRNS